MGQDDAQLGAFDGEIVCETPNNLLNKFEGKHEHTDWWVFLNNYRILSKVHHLWNMLFEIKSVYCTLLTNNIELTN